MMEEFEEKRDVIYFSIVINFVRKLNLDSSQNSKWNKKGLSKLKMKLIWPQMNLMIFVIQCKR